MRIDPARLAHLDKLTAEKYAVLLVAMARKKDVQSRHLWAEKKLRDFEDETSRYAPALSPDARKAAEAVTANVAKLQADVAKSTAEYNAAQAEERRLAEKWTAAQQLSANCKQYAEAKGVTLPGPAPMLRPDMTPEPNGGVFYA